MLERELVEFTALFIEFVAKPQIAREERKAIQRELRENLIQQLASEPDFVAGIVIKRSPQRSCRGIRGIPDRRGAGGLGVHPAAAQEAAAGVTVGWCFTARSRSSATMLGGQC